MLAVRSSRQLTRVEFASSLHLFDSQREWCPGERGGVCLTRECGEIIAVGRGGQARLLPERKGRRTRWSQDPRGILGRNAEPTGTDGFRLLSHQFSPSSLPHQENCIRSSKTFSLKMTKLRGLLLLIIQHRGPGPRNPAYGLPASE
jgi:hypothetical protein